MAKMLGSFDPHLKEREVAKYQKKFGDNHVHLIQRSNLFLITKIIVPLVFYLIFYIGIILVINYFFEHDPEIIGYSAIIGMVFVILLFVSLNLKRLLDYLLDFIIITPSQIISFNQKGIRKRSNMTIETVKVKSINVNYRNWIFSIFNNGDIQFLSEGDSSAGGEIRAYYVHQPQQTKEKIYQIIQMADSHTPTIMND